MICELDRAAGSDFDLCCQIRGAIYVGGKEHDYLRKISGDPLIGSPVLLLIFTIGLQCAAFVSISRCFLIVSMQVFLFQTDP